MPAAYSRTSLDGNKDANASIDIGVVNNLERTGGSLAESSDARSRNINESWKNVFYAEVMEARIAKILQDRRDQLRRTAKFLQMARDQSVIRLPEFGKIEAEPAPILRYAPSLRPATLDRQARQQARLVSRLSSSAAFRNNGALPRSRTRQHIDHRRTLVDGLQGRRGLFLRRELS